MDHGGDTGGEEDDMAQLLIDEEELMSAIGAPSESAGSSSAMGETAATATYHGQSAIGVTFTYDGTSMTQSSMIHNRQDDTMDWELQPNIETNLAINQAYQELLDNLIRRVEMGLGRVRERQKILTSMRESSSTTSSKKKVPAVQFLPPYFKDSSGMAPPHNRDKREKLELGEYDALIKEPKKWTKVEQDLLKNAVRSSLIETRLVSSLSRKELLQDKIAVSGQHNSTAEIEAWKEELRAISRTIAYTKNLKDDQVFTGDYSTVDWIKIASYDFKGARTPDQCRLAWVNEQAPEWSKEKWTKKETDALKQLGDSQLPWDDVALKLGTRRTPWQCFEKYQSELNDNMHKKNWTAEEDEQLRNVVETVRTGSSIPWDQVAYYMEGRTRQQCSVRWRRSVDQNIKKGRWSEEEDLLLMLAVSKYGARDWQKMAEMVPGRTDAQCRERWCNALDKSNKMTPWTEEEDETLRYSVDTFGFGEWAQCSRLLPGRNPQACKMRFRSLTASGNKRSPKKKKTDNATRKRRPRRFSSSSSDDSEECSSNEDGDADFTSPFSTKTLHSASVRLVIPQSPLQREQRRQNPPHLGRTRKAHEKKEKVRQQFEELTGIKADQMQSETNNNNVDEVLATLPDEARRLIKLKLDAIKFKHAQQKGLTSDTDALDGRTPQVKRKRESSAPPISSGRAPERKSEDKELMDEAREEIKRLELESALETLVAGLDQRALVETRTKHVDAYYVATKRLYEQALSREKEAMPTLPPSLGSVTGLHKLFNMHPDLVQAAGRLFPTSNGQPLAKASTKPRAKENESRRRRRIGSQVAAESSASQSLDISLPEELLQTPQFNLLKRRMMAILTWPMLLSQVSTGVVEDFTLPSSFVDQRPAATWPELISKVPENDEEFKLPPDFLPK